MLLPTVDVPLRPGSRPRRLATISRQPHTLIADGPHRKHGFQQFLLLSLQTLNCLGEDRVENTVCSSYSLLRDVTVPTETLFTQPVHSNRLLFSSIITHNRQFLLSYVAML
jgi:hypothetical protein